jgi:hypothetical protein
LGILSFFGAGHQNIGITQYQYEIIDYGTGKHQCKIDPSPEHIYAAAKQEEQYGRNNV